MFPVKRVGTVTSQAGGVDIGNIPAGLPNRVRGAPCSELAHTWSGTNAFLVRKGILEAVINSEVCRLPGTYLTTDTERELSYL